MDILGPRLYVSTLKESGEYELAKQNREAEALVKKEKILKPFAAVENNNKKKKSFKK